MNNLRPPQIAWRWEQSTTIVWMKLLGTQMPQACCKALLLSKRSSSIHFNIGIKITPFVRRKHLKYLQDATSWRQSILSKKKHGTKTVHDDSKTLSKWSSSTHFDKVPWRHEATRWWKSTTFPEMKAPHFTSTWFIWHQDARRWHQSTSLV